MNTYAWCARVCVCVGGICLFEFESYSIYADILKGVVKFFIVQRSCDGNTLFGNNFEMSFVDKHLWLFPLSRTYTNNNVHAHTHIHLVLITCYVFLFARCAPYTCMCSFNRFSHSYVCAVSLPSRSSHFVTTKCVFNAITPDTHLLLLFRIYCWSYHC